jgi:hypothetical protein
VCACVCAAVCVCVCESGFVFFKVCKADAATHLLLFPVAPAKTLSQTKSAAFVVGTGSKTKVKATKSAVVPLVFSHDSPVGQKRPL